MAQIASRLRSLREKAGYTQGELAEQVLTKSGKRVQQSRISEWESAHCGINEAALEALVSALGLTMSEFWADAPAAPAASAADISDGHAGAETSVPADNVRRNETAPAPAVSRAPADVAEALRTFVTEPEREPDAETDAADTRGARGE